MFSRTSLYTFLKSSTRFWEGVLFFGKLHFLKESCALFQKVFTISEDLNCFVEVLFFVKSCTRF